jgi:hypothetical protein
MVFMSHESGSIESEVQPSQLGELKRGDTGDRV